MYKWKFFIFSLSVFLLTPSCSGIEIVITPAPSQRIEMFTPIPTFTAQPPLSTKIASPIPTSIVITSPTPTSTQGSGSYSAFYVITSASNVNLRTQPSTLFPVSRLLAEGTRLQVLGRAPGGRWLYVLTESNIYGWVSVDFVRGGNDSGLPPLVGPQDVQLVKGQVLDPSGAPVGGIGFALTQGTGPNAPRNDAVTDSKGQFYAYFPLSTSGQWIVSFVSVACTSNTMDANCSCVGGVCGRADPNNQVITLPYTGTLQFTWK